MRLMLETGVISALMVFLALGSAAAEAPGYRDVDLGARRSGEVFTLKLGAHNANCAQPIDFRFNSKSGWLRLPADPVVRQVTAGQTKYLEATVDLAGAAPGPKIGFIDIDCENCQFLIFKNCKINRETLRFNVNVVGDAAPGGGAPQQGSQQSDQGDGVAGADAPGAPMQIADDDDRIPKPLRRKAKAAHDDWREKLKKKKPCDEALLKLRAAATQAQADAERAAAAADTAEQDARNARAQEAARQEELKRANKESVDAQAAVADAEKALKEANRSGTTAERQEARANLEKAKAAQEAAKKRVADAARPFHTAKDLDDMDKNAARKRKAAKSATAQSAAADAAAAQKEKECLKIEQEVEEARRNAEDAAREAKAAIPVVSPPSAEEIEKARKAANDCIKELGELINAQAKAMQALASLGALKKDPDTGEDINTYDSDLSDWAKAVDQANDLFEKIPPGVEYLGPVGEAVDTYAGAAEKVLGAIRSAIGLWSGVKYTGRLNLAPKAGETKSPEKTMQYLKNQGLAGSDAEAKAILKQMESYSKTNSTKGMQQELADKKATCDALVGAAEAKEKAGK